MDDQTYDNHLMTQNNSPKNSEAEPFLEQLLSVIRPLIHADRMTWIDNALKHFSENTSIADDLLTLSAQAFRRLGHEPLGPHIPQKIIHITGMNMLEWSQTDLSRCLFLIKAGMIDCHHAFEYYLCYYRQGDEGEKIALIRSLSLLPVRQSLKTLALDAGRTNSDRLMTALIRLNPYPACYYNDHEFNQMILKALFMGISIAAVNGLQERANRELSRMCEDYIEERLAAGRALPFDIWLALTPHISSQAMPTLRHYLEHADRRHRYYVVQAMGEELRTTGKWGQSLRDRLKTEDDTEILSIIQQYLNMALQKRPDQEPHYGN